MHIVGKSYSLAIAIMFARTSSSFISTLTKNHALRRSISVNPVVLSGLTNLYSKQIPNVNNRHWMSADSSSGGSSSSSSNVPTGQVQEEPVDVKAAREARK